MVEAQGSAVRKDTRPIFVRRPTPFIVLAVLALVVGAFRWFAPRSYRLVARYPTYEITLIPATTGFLLWEKADLFTLRDWHGKERWRITTAFPPKRPNVAFALSPDGRIFAAEAATAQGTNVRIWRDGALIGEPNLPGPAKADDTLNLKALDDGRVFAYYESDRTNPIWVLKGQRILAKGSLPAALDTFIAPDGSAALNQLDVNHLYVPLTVADGVVRPGKSYFITEPLSMEDAMAGGWGFSCENAFFARGLVVADNGAVYGPNGRVSPPNGWSVDTNAPGGIYGLQAREGKVRVFSPVKRDSWEIRLRGEGLGGDATPDGRFALVSYVQTLPGLLQSIADTLDVSADHQLDLYQRPGKLRAHMHMKLGWTGSWYPSPDGHAMVVCTEDEDGNNLCRLYRW